jgi:hypothetical protein
MTSTITQSSDGRGQARGRRTYGLVATPCQLSVSKRVLGSGNIKHARFVIRPANALSSIEKAPVLRKPN